MINVALTNLGKYNEGELVFEWLELPATEEEIEEVLEHIGIGEEYEEYFISDYESPFPIGEYENLTKLNELAEVFDDIPEAREIFDGSYDAGDVLNFASELENRNLLPSAMEYVDDIVSDETLDELVKHEAESSWQRVAHFLSGIEFMNDDWYRINGYGNAENLTTDYLNAIVDDLLGDLKSELEDDIAA